MFLSKEDQRHRMCGAGVHACVFNPAPHPPWSAASVRLSCPTSKVSRSKDLLTGPASAASPARRPLRPPPFRRQTFISRGFFFNFFFFAFLSLSAGPLPSTLDLSCCCRAVSLLSELPNFDFRHPSRTKRLFLEFCCMQSWANFAADLSVPRTRDPKKKDQSSIF